MMSPTTKAKLVAAGALSAVETRKPADCEMCATEGNVAYSDDWGVWVCETCAQCEAYKPWNHGHQEACDTCDYQEKCAWVSFTPDITVLGGNALPEGTALRPGELFVQKGAHRDEWWVLRYDGAAGDPVGTSFVSPEEATVDVVRRWAL